jgi:hypothetical protein
MKVFLAAMLIDAFHAALEDAVEALQRVCVDLHASLAVCVAVLAPRMVNGVMLGELIAELGVPRGLIGHHVAFASKVRANDRKGFVFRDCLDMERASLAAALNERKHGVLMPMRGFGFRNALFPSDECLIHLDDRAEAAQRREAARSHRLTDAMTEKPCRLKRDAEGPMQLICAEAFFRGTEKMDCDQPIPHLDMAILENRADLDREFFPASIALIETDAVALAFEGAGLIDNAAMWANATLRPKARFDEGVGGYFIVEVSVGENGTGHGKISLCPNAITSAWSRQLEYRPGFPGFGDAVARPPLRHPTAAPAGRGYTQNSQTKPEYRNGDQTNAEANPYTTVPVAGG